jgi:biopolymer transport protein TolR
MKRYQRENHLNNSINIVPYLDVLLVLLIIFMITAQSINAGMINLPSVSKSSQINSNPIILSIMSDHYVLDGKNYQSVREIIIALNNTDDSKSRLISVAADKNIKYDLVVKTLDTLYKQNYRKVSLLVDQKTEIP